MGALTAKHNYALKVKAFLCKSSSFFLTNHPLKNYINYIYSLQHSERTLIIIWQFFFYFCLVNFKQHQLYTCIHYKPKIHFELSCRLIN